VKQQRRSWWRVAACVAVLTLAACDRREHPVDQAAPANTGHEPAGTESGPMPERARAEPGGVDYPQVEALAPIDDAEIQVRESMPPQYAVRIQSGLPSGCARFHRIDVERDGTEFEVSVWNLVPHPDAEVMCTMIYGMAENAAMLDGDFEHGQTYTVYINNDVVLDFQAQ
jgi:hypothetical protein